MENQKSKFLSLKSKNKRVRLGLISFVSCLILAFAWGILVFSDTALADKPDKPPGKGKKGDEGAFQDMPLCIDFDSGQLIPNVDPLCDSSRGITAFAGRRWSIVLEIHKKISDPYLILPSPWVPLTPILGDPGYPDWGMGDRSNADSWLWAHIWTRISCRHTRECKRHGRRDFDRDDCKAAF